MAGPNDTSATASTLIWWRLGALGVLSVAALLAFVVLAYEVALAKVPQHRAALERLVRSQTGLDLRFAELALRWGWYGPEAVFERVELGEHDGGETLLRAPRLTVGLDTWRTLRSGQPQAGRIELTSPDIELASPKRTPARDSSGSAAADSRAALEPALERLALLRHWRGGRVDIEGGSITVPIAGRHTGSLKLRIQQASLRHTDAQWSLYGLVFLPERLGRTLRVIARLSGDVGSPARLSGAVQVQAARLSFAGWRGLMDIPPVPGAYLPSSGGGDLDLNLTFRRGTLIDAGGSVQAGGLTWAQNGPRMHPMLDHIRGNWRLVRGGGGWRVQVDSLELDDSNSRTSLLLYTAAEGERVRGTLQGAPLSSLVSVGRLLFPGFDLGGIELEGVVQKAGFDWDARRAHGQRLQSWGTLTDVTLRPSSRDFTLSGLTVRVSGSESSVLAQLRSRTARLELTRSRQPPLADVHVQAAMRIEPTPDGWLLSTRAFTLEQQHARLTLSGSVRRDASLREPELQATGTLQGADVGFVRRLLGASTEQAFGAIASQLTAGNIEDAHFEMQGPTSELPFGEGLFTGSLNLRRAAIAGGELWPDAAAIDAHVQWHGAHIRASIDSADAGPFQLAAIHAEWDAEADGSTRVSGRVGGRLEDALAWLRTHPHLQAFVPGVAEVRGAGHAAFDFDWLLPVAGPGRGATDAMARSGRSAPMARVAARLDDTEVQTLAGLPPLHAVSGSFLFDQGRLQHSSLSGRWLGGPVTLELGERKEQGRHVLTLQARGNFSAARLASLANADRGIEGSPLPDVHGNALWSGELEFAPSETTRSADWRMHADSNLLGVASSLPAPFAKRAAASAPLHLELSGADGHALLQIRLGDRLHGTLALRQLATAGWSLERGAIAFGKRDAPLPSEHVLLLDGHVTELDLPESAVAWQRLRRDSMPPVRARILADHLLVGSQSYAQVSLDAERTEAGTALYLDSKALRGEARWPNTAPADAPVPEGTRWVNAMRAYWQGSGVSVPVPPAQVHLSQIELDPAGQVPTPPLAGALRWVATALGPAVQITVDRISWGTRSLGSLSARLAARAGELSLENVHLRGVAHDARAQLHCEPDSMSCRMSFSLDSTDVAATLVDFGFQPDLTGPFASISGALRWRPVPGQSWMAGLTGALRLQAQDGAIRPETTATRVMNSGGLLPRAEPFALLAVPALVGALQDAGAGAAVDAPLEAPPLRFARLDANFDLRDGEARTSNLHFDGDAEILMRGRTGLLARDYDQQVWVLRGEERLPAAIRRFGATAPIAAAWLSLRGLFTGVTERDRSGARLHLQGSWQAPIVVAGN